MLVFNYTLQSLPTSPLDSIISYDTEAMVNVTECCMMRSNYHSIWMPTLQPSSFGVGESASDESSSNEAMSIEVLLYSTSFFISAAC